MIDLHTHSTASDGQLSPEQLVALANECGLSHLALTDHDTVDGLPAFFEAGRSYPNLTLIGGIEISCVWKDRRLHILGYGLGETISAPMAARLQEYAASRSERLLKILERLSALGLPIPAELILNQRQNKVIGRPHIAGVMMEKGYVHSIDEAFQRYLGRNGEAYMERAYPQAEDVIAMLRAERYAPVIAHPLCTGMATDELDDCARALREYGLMGLETYYPSHGHAQVGVCQTLARRYGLLRTGGSDFHGDHPDSAHPGRTLGAFHVAKALAIDLMAAIDSLRSNAPTKTARFDVKPNI